MNRNNQTLVAIAILVGLAGLACAADRPADPNASKALRLGDNAALVYWQAIGVLPKFTEAQEAFLYVEQALKAGDVEAQKALSAGESSLRLLKRAAGISACDWGCDVRADGIATLLPHLGPLRQLARLGTLRARMCFAQGQWDEGIDWCMAVTRMSRHAGDDTLINVLVGYGIRVMPITALAANVPAMPPAARQRLAGELAKAPPVTSVAQGLAGERAMVYDWLAGVVLQSNDARAEVTRLVRAAAGPKRVAIPADAPLEQWVRELGQAYDRLIEQHKLPLDEFEKQGATWDEEIKKGNPLSQVLLPSLSRARLAEARVEAQARMLRAGIALLNQDPATFDAMTDPRGGKVFEKRDVPGGFELVSKLTVSEGKPLVLTIAPPAAPTTQQSK